MSGKHPRVFGTTDDAIANAEAALGRTFPPSFRGWLLQNNGHGIEAVTIFPVMDRRDPRMTWDSIDRRFREGWTRWLDNFADEQRDFTHLLPFADYGTGDYYCFDYSRRDSQGESPVVRWSHETGDTDDRGASFPEFATKVQAGEFDND
ncbi:SMI1/KNR4 family protein [Verrucomicrobium sp. BvORR106]|uniref:SMI1/KNR4 family protein n=1 Tax=Verrucomicrobium sp. BvORR106 TaxID=1403819 RepID=UPI0007C84AE8|nr:SMI1/KNR4 family protein [Verrucomicrobium sp. BvORR106]